MTSAWKGFAVRKWAGTVEMVVVGPWSDQAAEAFETENVDRLVLNGSLGFNEPSLDFVRDLPVRELEIRDGRFNSQGLEPLYLLSETLTKLDLAVDPDALVDLARLPRITALSATWRQVKRSIRHAAGLETLYLESYGEPDLTPLSLLRSLVELRMKERPKIASLHGLSAMSSIRHLGIFVARNLMDVTELRTCRDLMHLELEGCRRIASISDIEPCVGLQFLNLAECGHLPTIAPIRALTRLNSLWLYGDTKVLDGDLAPVLALPILEDFRMMSRRSYKPSVPEVERQILQRKAESG